MSTGILSTHGKGSVRMTREQLAAVPCPPGTWTHKPVPHAELVDVMGRKLEERGLVVEREQFAVSPNGMKLFGVMNVKPTDETLVREGGQVIEGTGWAVGFRASNDKSLAIQIVAGLNVFVCDNLALSGSAILAYRRHSRSLSITNTIETGLSKYFGYLRRFQSDVSRAMGTHMDDDAAKRMIFDLTYQGILAPSLFTDFSRNYFLADRLGYTDCQPRTQWGLHNSATRAIKALTPGSAFNTTQRLGAWMGLGKINEEGN